MRLTKHLAITLAFVLLLTSCGASSIGGGRAANEVIDPASELRDGKLVVTFFDVGQADCILVQLGDHNMLIDAGDQDDDALVSFLLAQRKVTDLDYLVATHPHADHIGAIDTVIKNMTEIHKIIAPNVSATTVVFRHFFRAMVERNLRVYVPKAGENFEFGEASIKILAPNGEAYEDLNNYSIVMRLNYKDVSFLFAGDAEALSEREQLDAGWELGADVLKVGHHGSHSSTTSKYLSAVSPSYAVISCGAGNDYGHPHNETLKSLKDTGVSVLRTDLNGSIIFSTDGEDLKVYSERGVVYQPSVSPSVDPAASDTAERDGASDISKTAPYIANKKSKVFHLPSCKSLPSAQNRISYESRDSAVKDGYRPCPQCQP